MSSSSEIEFDLDAFVDRLLNLDHVNATAEELEALCRKAIDVFSKEPSLVEATVPTFIVGGIDGSFFDLARLLKHFFTLGNNHTCIFLGNYTGDNTRSLRCIILILAIKCRRPDTFITLRGQQETMINHKSMLFRLLKKKYKEKAEMLYDLLNFVFSMMPLASLVSQVILCVHGGISRYLASLDSIRNIVKPTLEPCLLENDLIWSEPTNVVEGYMRSVTKRPLFGAPAVEYTCARLGVKLIVRTEPVGADGYSFFSGNRMVTLYSTITGDKARNQHNRSAAMIVDEAGKIGFKMFTLNAVSKEEQCDDEKLTSEVNEEQQIAE